MDLFIIVVVFVPYCIGFFSLCFWWRWWLLLPASVVVLSLKAIGFPRPPRDEPDGGPVLITSADIENELAFGAVWGAVACCVVILGRSTGLRFLAPALSLPLVFIAGAVRRFLTL